MNAYQRGAGLLAEVGGEGFVNSDGDLEFPPACCDLGTITHIALPDGRIMALHAAQPVCGGDTAIFCADDFVGPGYFEGMPS